MKSVFISSTFKDMQAERDYLHEKVFSRLRKRVGQYGEDVQELDLRWGVDTYRMSEEESGYQVLRVCIDAIDRCKPYIIVLLGERYGWIPDEKLVDSLRDERLTEHYESSMSITNLEIKYGALSEKETLERCIFCFRNPNFTDSIPEEKRALYLAESPEHEKRLNALKEQIRCKEHVKVIDYEVQWDSEAQVITGLEPFGEALFLMLWELLQKDLKGKEAKNPIEQYILEAQCTKERYLASYTPKLYEEREAVDGMWFMAGAKADRHHKMLQVIGEEEQCIHLTGDAGSGKSALMAALEQQAADAGARTILYFGGNPGCQNVEVLKSVILYRLEEILEIPHDLACENQNAYLRKLDERAEKLPIYCFIDALDQLFAGQQDPYLDLVDLCPNLFVITSALSEFPYRKALLRARKIRVIEVQKFTEEDKKALIRMTGIYRGKKLDDELMRQICAKESSGNPLFLSLVLQRLFAMRKEEFEYAEALSPGIDGLHLYMEQLIREVPEKVTDAAAQLFEYVSEIFQSAFFKKVSYLIALAETGLTEREIEEILAMRSVEFSQLKFQEILYYLYDVFTENDGRWVFAHRIFYEAMRQDMGREEETVRGDFIAYSEQNQEFLEREGWFHILKSKAAQGKKVLCKCKKWAAFGQVKHFVRQMSLEEGTTAYFLDMLEGGEAAELLEFWKSVSHVEDPGFQTLLRKIYDICVGKEELSLQSRLEALYKLLGGDDPEESTRHMQIAERLLSQISDIDTKKLWKIKFRFFNMWNLLDAGRGEEGLALLRSIRQETVSLFSNPELAEEAIYAYIWYSRTLVRQSRFIRKAYLPEYLEEALVLYGTYPQYIQNRRFRLAKIELYLEGAIQYRRDNQEKSKSYAAEAMRLARELSEEAPDTASLELLARSLNYYGHVMDRDRRYQYRYEALDVLKRIYQIEPTDYWQQETAAQAAFFAEDVSSLVQQLKLDDRDVWIQRGRAAWNLCFSYYEELAAKEYEAFDRTYYVDSLLNRAEEDVFKYYVDDAVEHAGKAYHFLKKDMEKGWRPETQQEIFRCWRAGALLAENLDDKWCAKEAVPYICEAAELAETLHGMNASPGTLNCLLASFRLAARILYHAGRDQKALEYAKKGEAILEKYKKEANQSMPDVHSELCYILARISLKKKDTETAKRYVKLLEVFQEEEQPDFWGKGRLLLLKGDLLFGEEDYEAARAAYDKAVLRWENYHEAILKSNRGVFGFSIRDGKVKRCSEERLWHIKSFYYYLYAIWQKAEAMRAGNLRDPKYSPSHTKKREALFPSHPVSCEEEYRCVFELCMEMVREEAYRSVADAFLFRTMDRLLESEQNAQWKNTWKSTDILALLCRLTAYCKKRKISMEKEYEVLADAFCTYDLSMMSFSPELMHENENCWIDIFEYLKQRIEEGMEIRQENKYLIGYLWFRLGCYKEAGLWFEQAAGRETLRGKAALLFGRFCHAMCAYRDGDREKLSETIAEIESDEEAPGHYGSSMLDGVYQELTENAAGLLRSVPDAFYIQESAQRYLHVLQIIAEQGEYQSLDDLRKEAFWSTAKKIRDAYYAGNKSCCVQKEGSTSQTAAVDSWEDRAAEMKGLTAGGMIWEIPFAEVEEKLFTLFRQVYMTCTVEEEKEKIAEQICGFWREEYRKIDLKRLSLENLRLLRETEQVTDRAMLPALAEELAIRLEDKGILHDFFRKVPEYAEKKDWKRLARARKMEIKEIFERLLAQETGEWAEDFRRWVSGELWIMAQMSCYKKIADFQTEEGRPVYEAYRQYQTEFKEKWREQWVERLRQCEG